MESLIILIPLALVLVAIALRIFFWAVNSGQFDDMEGPAHSILFDDDPPLKKQFKKTIQKNNSKKQFKKRRP
ncbi:MAG: cbb3-type cytochrome oxidase assembly protein CcoS [Candidatus Endonucleobacter bathymodioli]|uniref:Cbb3-type cytochrome oxidase assembly protein CcoS n=1 Tax=Candidatus Endonucleibacter bathymodioli TaxID=539814 RepID=A0AA90SXA1_9GAMM|nr:cbb3-type cytochrome oxidase assembly protein CcoS [Candidatus Endonucleobacter bathymodioli]